MISGRSALQALVNLFEGRELLNCGESNSEVAEPFGRSSYLHPLNKLKKYDVILGDEREITTLYRCRYMTNEQCYEFEGEKRRVNDLLAYPIFIASPLR
jgi:hypothetical protein